MDTKGDAGAAGWELVIVVEGGVLLDPPRRIELDPGERLLLGRGGTPANGAALAPEPDGRLIALRDRWLSRTHAAIERSIGSWVVTDLGSKNGTLLDGAASRRHEVAAATLLTIGQTLLVLAPRGSEATARWIRDARAIATTDPSNEWADGVTTAHVANRRGTTLGVQSAESIAALLRFGDTRREPAPATRQPGVDIQAVLAACGGNISEAARRLGKDRKQIQRWVARQRAIDAAQPGAPTARSTSANSRASSQLDHAGTGLPASRHSAAK